MTDYENTPAGRQAQIPGTRSVPQADVQAAAEGAAQVADPHASAESTMTAESVAATVDAMLDAFKAFASKADHSGKCEARLIKAAQRRLEDRIGRI